MAGSLNKVQLIGNLGADPEVRTLPNGGKVVNLSVATSEHWRDKDTGERREKTEWHRVVIFGDGLVKVAESYLRKGSKVYLEGQLRTRKWQDQGGNDRYSTEVVLQGFGCALTVLDSRRDDESGARERDDDRGRQSYDDREEPRSRPSSGAPSSRPGTARPGQAPAFESSVDDDIPF